jgi:hypothetical protein
VKNIWTRNLSGESKRDSFFSVFNFHVKDYR